MLVYLQNDLSVDICTIPVVVGELGRFYSLKNPGAIEVNKVLRHICDTHKNIGLVTSEGLTHRGDTLHFDSASQRELGNRYAKKIDPIGKGTFETIERIKTIKSTEPIETIISRLCYAQSC